MKKINPILLKEYKSFSDWEKAVEAIPDTTEKGDAMEHLTYFLLKSNAQYYNIKEIYMEDEIPEALRVQLKLPYIFSYNSVVVYSFFKEYICLRQSFTARFIAPAKSPTGASISGSSPFLKE